MTDETAPGRTEPPPGTPSCEPSPPEDGARLVERMSDAYLLGRLLDDVAHATNNDLQVVLGAVELLDLEPPVPTTRRRLAMIAEAATEAVERMADVRALAMSEERGRAAATATFAEMMAERTARLARLLAPGIALVVEIEPRLDGIPSPPPPARRSLERLLDCLVLCGRAIAPAEATLRLHAGLARDGEDPRLVLEVAGTAADVGSHASGSLPPPELALLSALAAAADGTLAREPRPDGGTRLVVTLPPRSRAGP